MTKHTPGPWRATDTRIFQDNPLNSVVAIASCNGIALEHKEHQANAILIAAAPETAAERDRLKESNAHMLAALKKVRRICASREFRAVEDCAAIHGTQYLGQEIMQPDIDEAISKAEGEKES